MTKPLLFCALGWLSAALALAQSGTLQFDQALYTVSEAGPIAFTDQGGTKYLAPPLTVTRIGGSTGAVTVSYCVWVNETTDNAVEGQNYDLADNMRVWVAAGTITWASGDTAPKTLPFTYTAFSTTRYNLRTSSLVQGTLTYTARLVNVVGGATLGANATSRLEVLDAEAPAAGVLNLSSRRYYGPEGGTTVVTVRRDGGTTGSVSVNYTTSSTLPAVGSNQQLIGAGIAGTHYTATSGTLTWAAGDGTVKTFTISLPATGSANGPLNVAVNLSSPTNSAVLGTVPSALLTIQNQASTVYDINDNIDGSTYRVSLPPGSAPIRGVLFWFPGSGGDDRHFTTDPNFRKIADQWRFAIASPRFNYDSSPNRFEFPYPKLSFFFNRLAQMAKTTGRAEIAHAPFVLSGMSAGSYSTSESLNIWPERTIAALGQEGWVYPPLPLTATTFDPLAKEIPSLNLGGQNEGTQSPPSSIFPAFNEFRKGGVTRSAVMMCWGRGHTFSNTGAAYNSVALYWLDQVMAAGRYPPAQAPTSSVAPVLGSLPLTSGWWGARNSTNTKGTSNFYELSGGSSRYLNIASDAAFTGIKDVNNALVDSWLPTESAARAYRAFVSLPTITFSAPAQFTSGLTGDAVTLSISENGFGAGLTKIEFYDGTTKIGEDTTSPYSLSWTPTVAGARSLTAIASNASGPAYTAFTLFLASDPVAPTLAAGQAFSGVVNLPFAYQLSAGGPPTSYALASGTLPPGVTLNTATGVLAGTPTTAGTYTPAFTATNSIGTSAPVTATFTIAATAGLILHEAFAYPVATNAPDPDAGLNGGNGLPATNVGGAPSGTSTGLRGTWNTSTDVVAGLAYAQGNKTLATTGGAGRVNNATFGGSPAVYRNMTTDPFLAQRIGVVNTGNFGVDGTSLYVSFLASTSSDTAASFRLSFRHDGSANFYVSNTATGWSLNGTAATSAALALNTPTLLVLRFDFAAGAADAVSLWVNPALGAPLGTPNATVSGLNFPGLGNLQTNPTVANAMTFDELRVGTSLAAVIPFTEPAAPLAPGGLAASAASYNQINLTWTDNSADETGFKLERSLDGSTGWTQIAAPTANATSYADTGRSPSTAYHYRLRATNATGDSAYTATATATTPAIPADLLIIAEPFAYTVGVNAPDPDAGLNGGNGLPTTNTGGSPSGTSTGLRGTWNTTTDVVGGLAYVQGNKTLTTSGGAGRVNNAGFGGNPFLYRNMTIDPFLAQRIGAVNTGNFGVDGTSLYVSFLGSTTSATAASFRLSLRHDGSANFYVSNTATGWSLNGTVATVATGVALALDTPTLFVVRFDFAAGATDTVSLWVNPPLGSSLGTPHATVTGLNFPGLGNLQTNAAVANAMTFDELRVGTSYIAVTPHTETPATGVQSFRTTYDLAADGSQDLLTPAGDGVASLLKYAFNMLGTGTGQAEDIDLPNAAVLTAAGSAGLPLVGVGTGADAGKLQLTYIRRTAASDSGITYAVEFSDALASWAVNTSAAETVTSVDSTFERVTVTDSVPGPAKRFVRVRVTPL